MSARSGWLAAAGLVVGCAACSVAGSGAGSEPTVSKSAAAESAPSASRSVQETAAPAAPAAAITPIPQRSLTGLPGLRYVAAPGPEVPQDLQTGAEVVEGFISRIVVEGSQPVGTVQLFRFRRSVASAPTFETELIPQVLSDFSAGEPSTRVTVGEQTVWLVDRPRKQPGAVVAFHQGADLILIWSPINLKDAQRLTSSYLAGG